MFIKFWGNEKLGSILDVVMLNEVKHRYLYDSWETRIQSQVGTLFYGNGCTKTEISSIMHSKIFKYEQVLKCLFNANCFIITKKGFITFNTTFLSRPT